MSRRVQWVQYKGKRLFQVDIRSASRDEQLEALAAYSALLKSEPDASVRVLVIAGEFDFHPDVITKAKAHLLDGQPKVLRSALVGVDGILRVAIEGFIAMARFLGMSMNQDRGRHFENEEEAKDWLISR
jgi:hypothetical protein